MEDETVRGDFAAHPEDHRGGSGWVTTKVAAEALGVHPRTIRAYIEQGELEAKSEGEGVQKTYLVAIDSVYALRDRRGLPRQIRGSSREKSMASDVTAADLTDVIRDLTAELVSRSQEAAELRTRFELTARAESTLREQLERERERADRLEQAQEEANRLRTELEAERSKGFWRRLFGR